MTPQRRLLALLLVVVWPLCGAAAWQPDKFEHVLDLGAPGAQTCLQDRAGFLWFGTDGGGLFRYDGYDLISYAVGAHGLANGNIWRILEDPVQSGILWIGTSGGLHRFDQTTGVFTRYQHDPADPTSIGQNTIQDIVPDGRDPHLLWLGTAGGGLNRFDKRTGQVTRYVNDPDKPDSLSFDDVWRLIEDRRDPDILWIGTYGGGLDRFDKRTGAWTHYTHDPANPQSLGATENHIDALLQDRDDPAILWLGTPSDGLDRFDTRTGVFTHYPASLTNGEVGLIYDDGQGTLWLGGYVTNNGLTLFDKRTATVRNYRHAPDDPASLSNDLVVNVHEDRAGIFWVTTYAGNVDKLDPRRPNFALYQHQPQQPHSLSASAITTLFEDRRGTIWIGTQGGLNAFDPATRTFTRFQHDPDDPASLDADYVLGVYEDAVGDFWVSLYVGPLIKFDRATGRVLARYASIAESITQLVADPQQPELLWLGTHAAGLGQLNTQTGALTFYQPDAAHPANGPSNTYIQTLLRDATEDVLWFGGAFGGGLNRFDLRTRTFTHYQNDPHNPASISADALATIYQDTQGRLWLGTKGGGLNLFDKHRATFTAYAAPAGVPDDVNGILEDDTGKLWLGTNAGLVMFDPDTARVMRRYDRADGLQGNLFLQGSALRTRAGQLWFGGTKGVNAFDPRTLPRNLAAPPIVLTALTQAGEPFNGGKLPVSPKLTSLTLPWRRNFFEFEYAALNYTNPAKNQYQYMLAGFDNVWYAAGTRRFGRYSNLPGGDYTLRIIGSNNDGVWNHAGVSLHIHVASPFWATRWFRLLLAVSVMGGAGGVYYARVRTIAARNRVLERLVHERTADLERHQVQLQESETRFRKFAEATFEGIVLHDQGRILDVNQVACTLFGYAPDEIFARELLDFIAPASRQFVACNMQSGFESAYETEGMRKDGTIFPIEVQVKIMPVAGRPIRAVALRDITARKRAEDAQATRLRYEIGVANCSRSLLSDAPIADVIDAILEHLLAASAVSRVYVYENFNDPQDGLCMRNVYEVCAEGVSPQLHNPFFQHLPYRTFQLTADEIALLAYIGGPIATLPRAFREVLASLGTLSILILPIRVKGQFYGFIGFDSLVEARAWLPEEIRLLQVTAEMLGIYLERKRTEEELRQAKLAAEQANNAKSEFLARMSHELRTPLNMMAGMTYLLTESGLTPAQRNTLERMQQAARELLGLINNLLDFASLDTGKFNRATVNFYLDEFLAPLFRQFAQKAHAKGLTMQFQIRPDTPCALSGELAWLEKILCNLLDNAIKFTPRGEITLIVGRAAEAVPDAKQVALEFIVRDTGIGIAPAQLLHVFDLFYQVDGSSTRTYGGIGLGLTICKTLAERLGGRIWAESTPGGGSVFGCLVTLTMRQNQRVATKCQELSFAIPPTVAAPVPGADDKPLEVARVAPLFAKLANLLREGDIEATECLETLVRDLEATAGERAMHDLAHDVKAYNFERALEKLTALAQQLNLPGTAVL